MKYAPFKCKKIKVTRTSVYEITIPKLVSPVENPELIISVAITIVINERTEKLRLKSNVWQDGDTSNYDYFI